MGIKPIKRNENIVPISREHHATLLFCWKLRSGVKMGVAHERICKYILWFREQHLNQHFKTEEELLFRDKNDPAIKKALDEHVLIRNQIEKLSDCKGDVDMQILALADSIDKHTRYEERELFPYIEEKFPENELNEIGAALHVDERSAAEEYKDEFWIKAK
ncbi:MAG TPA: hypothetical protein PKA53_13250 [Sphingobacterium sp.]|nr:hypothetical protein [Sphingobacterium sp.]